MSVTEATQQESALYNFLEEFLADAVTRFPELEGRLIIIDDNEKRLHISLDPKKCGYNRETVLDYVEKETANDKSSCSFFDPTRKLASILIMEPVSEPEREHLSLETIKHLFYVLDHELAHMALKNGTFNTSKTPSLYEIVTAECVCDAYARLRHYQRFGTDSDYHDSHVDTAARAGNMISHKDREYGQSHFTGFVIEEIDKRKHQIDFTAMDPAQTADLAWRFAMQFMPPPPVLQELGRLFKPVRDVLSTGIGNWMKKLVDITLDPRSDYYAFKLGNLWLEKYVRERHIPGTEAASLPTGYMDDVAKRLKEREFKLAQEDILFNMPLATANAAPAMSRNAPAMRV